MNFFNKIINSKYLKYSEYILNILFLIYILKCFINGDNSLLLNIFLLIICLFNFLLTYKRQKISYFIQEKLISFIINKKIK